SFGWPLGGAAIAVLGWWGKVQSSQSRVEFFLNGLLIRAGAAQIAPALVGTFSASQSGQGAAAAIDALTYAPPPFNATQSNGQPNITCGLCDGSRRGCHRQRRRCQRASAGHLERAPDDDAVRRARARIHRPESDQLSITGRYGAWNLQPDDLAKWFREQRHNRHDPVTR